ncbi:hypothetical protein Patl1_18105 [Pistacia atlantica]|uniref:Uncharacterized protein n=1 Tax=Pistacia atlantica TaxID=434234 RepID=A0ACC1C1R6_9ROSI|nr:hypothetical protein Patl1_18105 [Pistacia atlantica]
MAQTVQAKAQESGREAKDHKEGVKTGRERDSNKDNKEYCRKWVLVLTGLAKWMRMRLGNSIEVVTATENYIMKAIKGRAAISRNFAMLKKRLGAVIVSKM